MFTFRRKKQRELYAPVNGCGIALDDVRDEVFSKRLMGDGCAFLPETTSVCSPIDGDLILVADTLHAFGVRSREGIELLIHIGLDTVQLNGEGFQARVAQGDRVKKGQLLVSFDMAFIEEKGYCLETPVLVTNSDNYLEVVETAAEHVAQGDVLLKVLK